MVATVLSRVTVAVKPPAHWLPTLIVTPQLTGFRYGTEVNCKGVEGVVVVVVEEELVPSDTTTSEYAGTLTEFAGPVVWTIPPVPS